METVQSGGFAIAEQSFDEHGRLIEVQYFDKSKNPVSGFDGFNKVSIAYNALGLPINYTGILPNSEQVNFVLEYSPRRNLTKIAFLDDQANLITSRLGFAELQFEYDEKFKLKFRHFYNKDGKLVATK